MRKTITKISILLVLIIVAGKFSAVAQTATYNSSANTLIIADTSNPGIAVKRGTIAFSKAQAGFFAKDYTKWVPIATIAANGLSRSGDTVKLGGTLTDPNTVLNLNNNQFTIQTGGTAKLYVGQGSTGHGTKAYEINVGADNIQVDSLTNVTTVDTNLNYLMTFTKANASDTFGVVQKLSINNLLGRQLVQQTITMPGGGLVGTGSVSFAVPNTKPGDFVQVSLSGVSGLSSDQTSNATDGTTDITVTGQPAVDGSGFATVSGYVSTAGTVTVVMKSSQIITGTADILLTIIKGS